MVNKVQTGHLFYDLDPQDVGPRLAFIKFHLDSRRIPDSRSARSLPSREGPHYCLSTWFLTK